MKIAKIIGIVIVLGIVLYFIYTKMIKPKQGEILPQTGPLGIATAPRAIGDANLCSWLNGTYPKMKTKNFDQLEGGRDNPQALKDWQANNCDLINY